MTWSKAAELMLLMGNQTASVRLRPTRPWLSQI